MAATNTYIPRFIRLGALILGGLLAIGTTLPAMAAIYETDKLKVYGDFRLRMEQDWDSQTSSGNDRDDRLRARIRLRVGMNYKPTDMFDFGIRLRTGSDESQQSPHITIEDFNNNDAGDSDINFDKWYLKAKRDDLWGWVGRNGLPIEGATVAIRVRRDLVLFAQSDIGTS